MIASSERLVRCDISTETAIVADRPEALANLTGNKALAHIAPLANNNARLWGRIKGLDVSLYFPGRTNF